MSIEPIAAPPAGALSGSRSAGAASGRVVVTDSGHERVTHIDLRPATNQSEKSLLAALLGTAGGGRASELLRRLTGDETMTEPDYLAVRTGSHVTPTFSGGAETWTWTHDDTVMTFFGTGEQPSASKGVAIAFGAESNSADRDVLTRIAMVWLGDHLDDAPSTGGLWNRPLIDVTA
jgi:hypothetical protein